MTALRGTAISTNGPNATPGWAWRSGVSARRRLAPGFLARSPEEVAADLLGQRIVSTVGGRPTQGVIVETEAYIGPEDPASHAAARIGRTARNEVMFGRAGLVYVYLIYGMHWCMNVVTGVEGHPSAVLIRALEPLAGLDVMEERRARRPLTSGPARLCEALGVTGRLNGHDLAEPPLRLLPGWPVERSRIARSGRIGVRQAADWPLRFYLKDHPDVSG